MFNQAAFGEKLKNHRKQKNLTQEEVAERIGVSGQAVSKWEKGECLPDVYNLKLLGKLYRVSVDSLLDDEKVIEIIKIGEAVFEVVKKPTTILAGKIIKLEELESVTENQQQLAREQVIDCVLPVCDITLSVDFWREESQRYLGYVRETTNENQPESIDVYKMPASLYIRAYTDKYTAQLLAKKECEIWELFAYIRNYFMPEHGFGMNENGAQEMEVFDTAEHKTGYAYMPVIKTR